MKEYTAKENVVREMESKAWHKLREIEDEEGINSINAKMQRARWSVLLDVMDALDFATIK